MQPTNTIYVSININMWLGGVAVGHWTCDQQVAGSNPSHPTVECNPGQVVNTHVPLLPSWAPTYALGRAWLTLSFTFKIKGRLYEC